MINAAMLAYNVACHSQGDMQNAHIGGMRAALEAVWPDGRDAARYRWLRDPDNVHWVRIFSQPHGNTVFDGTKLSELDEAIDAAMQESDHD